MNKKQIATLAIKTLKKCYPDAECTLNFSNKIEFLVASILSAQCTDKRVNLVTKKLFENFNSIKAFNSLNAKKLENFIRPCGLYKIKARNILLMCKSLEKNFNSKVPDTLENLLKLPGVGRKIANLTLGELFKKPCIVVDTHCFRLTKRLTLQNETTANKAEFALKKILPQSESRKFCHRLVSHGRLVCKAQKPTCEKCLMSYFCAWFLKQKYLRISANAT